ncbi:MAG: hypothetical protein VYD54_04825 [Bdellovibrionota bacterium]|nr:hypothetical protein [Bdellovibrionota bacterium]
MLKFLIIFFLFLSCSGEDNYMGVKEMYYLARDWQKEEWLKSGKWKESQFEEAEKKDPKFKFLLADAIGAGPTCKNYDEPPGCISVHMVWARKVEFRIIEFDKEENAILFARRLRTFYKFNWVFDEVVGEPVVESAIKQAFGAKMVEMDIKEK